MAAAQHPYLRDQLIAYIGSKRALQPFLAGIFGRLFEPGRVFLDPFAGSGAVSRLARWLGFRVLAGDWEPYAYVLNYAYLCVGRAEAEGFFRKWGGPRALIEELNALPDPPVKAQYIARHYAPARTETADYRTERLFYTRENALRIDALRGRIEELYPGFAPEAPRQRQEKYLLLASLLYGAATHVNTSGVFKACHKGFGGHGRDALGRILAPIGLRPPQLFDGPPAEAGCLAAEEFLRGRTGDLCYLDPPYNQHQYGSNYHLLNTIALWDKPEVSSERRPDGTLRHKAGIRSDWVKTRSAFCSRADAPAALARLLDAVDARTLVLSYNTEGIIPFEELAALLEARGELELHGSGYVKYRGGRQSIDRQVYNTELLLVVDSRRRRSGAEAQVRRFLLAHRLRLQLAGSFRPERVRQEFEPAGEGIEVRLDGRTLELPMERLHRFSPTALGTLAGEGECASIPELERLERRLEACACRDRGEELDVVTGLLGRERDERLRAEWQRRALWLLRKLAHRKYRPRFEEASALLHALATRGPRRFALLAAGLPAVERQAAARFAG
jgi:adenine-specific DNA-methyltransferase